MKKLEQIDQLSAKLAHLDALLASLSGSGTVSFRELNNTHQANRLFIIKGGQPVFIKLVFTKKPV